MSSRSRGRSRAASGACLPAPPPPQMRTGPRPPVGTRIGDDPTPPGSACSVRRIPMHGAHRNRPVTASAYGGCQLPLPPNFYVRRTRIGGLDAHRTPRSEMGQRHRTEARRAGAPAAWAPQLAAGDRAARPQSQRPLGRRRTAGACPATGLATRGSAGELAAGARRRADVSPAAWSATDQRQSCGACWTRKGRSRSPCVRHDSPAFGGRGLHTGSSTSMPSMPCCATGSWSRTRFGRSSTWASSCPATSCTTLSRRPYRSGCFATLRSATSATTWPGEVATERVWPIACCVFVP